MDSYHEDVAVQRASWFGPSPEPAGSTTHLARFVTAAGVP